MEFIWAVRLSSGKLRYVELAKEGEQWWASVHLLVACGSHELTSAFLCISPRVPLFFVLFGYLPDPPVCHVSFLWFSSCPLLSDISQTPATFSLVGTSLETTPWTPDRHSSWRPNRFLNGTDAQSWVRRRVKDGVGSASSQFSRALGPLPHHSCQNGKLNAWL